RLGRSSGLCRGSLRRDGRILSRELASQAARESGSCAHAARLRRQARDIRERTLILAARFFLASRGCKNVASAVDPDLLAPGVRLDACDACERGVPFACMRFELDREHLKRHRFVKVCDPLVQTGYGVIEMRIAGGSERTRTRK